MAAIGSAMAGCLGSAPPTDDDTAAPPDFQAATFTNPTQIDNRYFPLVPGTTWTYSGETEDGTERVVVEVLDESRVVAGVTCRVVRDRVYLDDLLIEDTFDWYAQDDAGNVWYMGEMVDNYNYDAQDNFVEITHEGAWEAGLDVANVGTIALPGYQMPASRSMGDMYHQEHYVGEAEDAAEIMALNVSVTLSNGTIYSCLQTRDYNTLDPGAEEYKYYASGVGLVLEETVGGDERLELVSVQP